MQGADTEKSGINGGGGSLPNREKIGMEKMRLFLHQLSASGISEHFLSGTERLQDPPDVVTVATRER
jgi:hypothetical protein